eukprot:SAG31_NODE_11246_length_1050_cov_1.344900_2_plen_185_part_00
MSQPNIVQILFASTPRTCTFAQLIYDPTLTLLYVDIFSRSVSICSRPDGDTYPTIDASLLRSRQNWTSVVGMSLVWFEGRISTESSVSVKSMASLARRKHCSCRLSCCMSESQQCSVAFDDCCPAGSAGSPKASRAESMEIFDCFADGIEVSGDKSAVSADCSTSTVWNLSTSCKSVVLVSTAG